jgi:hypothetical protein
MKVQLVKPSRILLPAGSVIDVDPARGAFLMSVGAAVPAPVPEDKTEKAVKPEAKKETATKSKKRPAATQA